MHVSGIVCEYNPFHHGHIHHILETRKLTNCDVLICVMSGNFVQRGEPAIIDKWKRTKAALENGCDLVIELPFAYATQSAQAFAHGAITSLSLAGAQDIVFGSEQNDIEGLTKLAQLDVSHYQDFMNDGQSCNKAYEQLYGKISANDILGINYLREALPLHMKAYTIQRTNDYHEEHIHTAIASASAIRKAVQAHRDVTINTCMASLLDNTYTLEHYYPTIQNLLLTLSPAYLKTLFLMDEGIEHLLIEQAKACDDITTFLQATTSKRYSTSRIRRTLLHLLNQTKKEDIDTLPPLQHIRLLGFNSIGKQYLKQIKKEEVCIASRFNQIPQPYRDIELKAANVYGIAGNRKEIVDMELQPPMFIK